MMRFVRGRIFRAAAVFAALCGLAVATPAFAHGDHGAMPAVHAQHNAEKAKAHQDAPVEASANNASHHSDGRDGAATCCGLFCVSAALQQDLSIILADFLRTAVPLPLNSELLGQVPERLDRPPTA
jgi:hypothetical protein